MKKDRACGAYPVYPPYQNMMPMPNMGVMPNMGIMPNMGVMPNMGMTPTSIPTMSPEINITEYEGSNNNGLSKQLDNIERQIVALERRISILEGNNNTNYNASNFHMV